MSKVQSLTLAGISALALVAGVILGTGAITSAQTNTPSATPAPTASAPAATPSAPTGTFQSNEDPVHEANETPEEEAAEDAGQGHCPHHQQDDTQQNSGTQTPSS